MLVLGGWGDRLCLCDWLTARHHGAVALRLIRGLGAEFEEGLSPVIEMAAAQLDEYFSGHRRDFDIPLQFVGTDFQMRVWSELHEIPYGSTVTYAALARSLGKPDSVRAVANSVGANAISIFAPCHRVMGADGSLTGYAGGLDAKGFLLKLERTS